MNPPQFCWRGGEYSFAVLLRVRSTGSPLSASDTISFKAKLPVFFAEVARDLEITMIWFYVFFNHC